MLIIKLFLIIKRNYNSKCKLDISLTLIDTGFCLIENVFLNTC